MYDVVIIGAGVCGSAVARELSRYKVKVCIVEKGEDVCVGTSKANSGIVHAGYDATNGTLMAKLNVQGNEMMEDLSKELDFPFKRNGSLVVCFSEEDIPKLQKLYDNGVANGVKELRILKGKEIRKMEANISEEVIAGLYAPTAGIVCPFGLNIALAENANTNGVVFKFDTEVTNIVFDGKNWELKTKNEVIKAKIIINAAGVYADKFHNMVSDKKIHITARKGDYCLLDKKSKEHVKNTIFQLANKYGKGVLVAPTTHGNIIIGPTALDIEDKEGTNSTANEIAALIEKSGTAVKNMQFRNIITSFAGLRAHEDNHEFIIGEVEGRDGFIDCAGIESPGLTSAPAIGVMIAKLVKEKLDLKENPDFVSKRKGILDPKTLSKEDYAKLIQEKPAYGNIICRCEMVTEGEIIDAIHRPLGAKSLDAIKRRTRAGMGRCQAGFCAPKNMEILAHELDQKLLDITKCGGNSKMLVGRNKEDI